MKNTNHDQQLHNDVIETLRETSRTFFIPISLLVTELRETVASAYLCMRAIDEIEDHPDLEPALKSKLLHNIGDVLQSAQYNKETFIKMFKPFENELPEVTLRLYDWISFCPDEIRVKVVESTAIMASGMGDWVDKDWQIQSEADLDQYTYTVAGLVGVMLTDIWKWYDGTEADKELGIGFGRGLQAVNILRNYKEDAERGVSFFPDSYSLDDMFDYAHKNLSRADEYVASIETETIVNFCQIPLSLAHGTLKALVDGREKMTRDEVNETVNKVIKKTS
ncbi:phytoene/squalene synthase family protein [Cytobacillus sp. FSL W7-1323]|uniref:Phytoene/squalene synthase family protein n=1 Tax=Cytobacillus kochii TaxID=859143 RepID=A0A248TDZ7_9BACI|nr:phytoene/squalene synthase family protein [Cytobacillus kochii]ASV66441.1 phytoene/squalene synthase family protein [Cytobacillus kochii]MDQ0187110.1 farnesyl-diphosphate farnesyltransferase [Cytobacillus kochii]MED1605411.1 phytoene/squalene synthase family protein [Cytobacillus kochii]